MAADYRRNPAIVWVAVNRHKLAITAGSNRTAGSFRWPIRSWWREPAAAPGSAAT